MYVATLALVASLFTVQDEVRIDVLNTRPSKVAERMRPMLPPSVRVDARDLEGAIVLRGPAEEIKSLRHLVPLFDVQNRLVRFDYSVSSPIDKLEYSGSILVPNNESHSFSETGTGLQMTLKPRINDDDTITIFVTCVLRGKSSQVVIRISRGESIYLKGKVFSNRRDDPKLVEALKKRTDDPFITVKAEIPR